MAECGAITVKLQTDFGTVRHIHPDGHIVEMPGALFLELSERGYSWPEIDYPVDSWESKTTKDLPPADWHQHRDGIPATAGVPLTPVLPPFEIAQKTTMLLTAIYEWLTELQKKQTPNASQAGARQALINAQGYLMQADINLP